MSNLAVAISNDNQNVTVFETIDAIKKAGFKKAFVQWYNKDWHPSQQEQLDAARKAGLEIIFAHLGYQNINHLWMDDEIGENLVDRYKNDLRICAENKIGLAVLHLTGKSEAPSYNEIGLRRLNDIAQYAKTVDMQIAFENTKIPGYQEYVMENLKSDNVGICFDSGHYHAHFHDELDFEKFKDRILAVHLHDNDESADLHQIPFDGTLDWQYVMHQLKQCHYQGPITMELCYRNEYLAMSLEDFYKKGYEAGIRLEALMNDMNGE